MYKIILLVKGQKDQESALWSYYFINNPVGGDENVQAERVEYSSDSIEDVQNTVEELLNVFEILSQKDIGILNPVKKVSSAENITYILKNQKRTVNRLRALAFAIEKGLG